jgi:[glutamine synthetase] adenylyltransferase / [glutamine synthetase]-adenylyl-L-tyrosine phosphorylase
LDGRVSRLGFLDPDPAQRTLAELRLWRDDMPYDAGAGLLVAELTSSAAPDLALRSLAALVAAAPKPAVLLAALRSSAGLRARLVGVLAASVPLGEFLARHPQEWPALADDATMRSRPTEAALRERLTTAVAEAPDDLGALDALRVAYRGALLRLAARDLAEDLGVDDVAAELADLAAAALDAALVHARRFAVDADAALCRLAVIGMGKCGGRELNYVSDVDVVFVAEPAEGADETAALRTATRLAEGVIRACGAMTPEGTLWPVDAALRPEGKAGPLVRTLASHVAYYERWAKTWEFQALLKARSVAGDRELGEAYLAGVAPLVWAAGERPDFVADVQAMKRRVEASVSSAQVGRELKLGPGGLRDVEFAVQLLQLVHGRSDETLRVGSTLVALDRLAAGGYVATEDADALAEAYRWLRLVEHRLQLQRLRRTHVVPDDEAGLRWVARAVGLRPGDDGDEIAQLRALHARSAVEVRRLHEKLFYRPLLSAVARLPGDALRLTPEAARDRLEALGFADPAGALRHLEAITVGLSRRAAVLRSMLPVMLPWFADAHDPDAGLLAFRSVTEAVGDSPWFLALLRDSDTGAERLARLLSASRYVADLVGRAPEAVALLGRDDELSPRPAAVVREELAAVAARHNEAERAVASVRALRRHELLRIACADLLGLAGVDEVAHGLTGVTEATLAAGLDVATRTAAQARDGALPCRLAIIGMGRLGGHEQGYGSDADVMFVHEPVPGATDDEAAAAAKQVAEELRRLLAIPGPDAPVDVDAGLRPEGRQGALTLSLNGYARYYERRAAVWEAQALLRARPVAGDAELASEWMELVAPVRYPGSFPEEAVREVRRIKARVEAERLPRGADRALHPKLGPGGLADVEWAVQLLQLRHAASVPGLRTPSTTEALAAAVAAGLLAPEDGEVLAEAWRLATRVRNAVVLVRGRPAETLPTDVRTLAGVARAVGYSATSHGQLLEDYRRATRRARGVVERVFYA